MPWLHAAIVMSYGGILGIVFHWRLWEAIAIPLSFFVATRGTGWLLRRVFPDRKNGDVQRITVEAERARYHDMAHDVTDRLAVIVGELDLVAMRVERRSVDP
jgi:hypothetical protein